MAKTIIHDELGKALWGDEDQLEVAQKRSFSEMVFELLSERAPSKEELELFELILNLSIDHGPNTPSAKEVIEKAKEGEGISESVAEGIEEINDSHGGAMEPAMEILYKAKSGQLKIEEYVRDALLAEVRVPGLGHRIYKDQDPRAELILERVQGIGGSEQFIELERALQQEVEKQTGKHLVINIDGAIAVALCALGWHPNLGKAVFIIARTPGLCGQYLNAVR